MDSPPCLCLLAPVHTTNEWFALPYLFVAFVDHARVIVPDGITTFTVGKGVILTVPVLGRLPAAYGPMSPAPALIADPDGNALLVEVVAAPPPALGSVAVDPSTGAVTFTPTAKYAKGNTSFVVRARESGAQRLTSGNATISITVGAWAAWGGGGVPRAERATSCKRQWLVLFRWDWQPMGCCLSNGERMAPPLPTAPAVTAHLAAHPRISLPIPSCHPRSRQAPAGRPNHLGPCR